MNIPIVDPRLSQSVYSDDPTKKKLQLDELRSRIAGGEDKDKQLREACQGFEAVFLQKIWEQMRNSIPKSDYLHSKEEEMYQSLYDAEFSQKMASAGGIGLADMLYEQLNVKLGQASRATSTSMLKKDHNIKSLDEEHQPIALKPRYGSLIENEKVSPELKAELATGNDDQLYEELNDEGLIGEETEQTELAQNASEEGILPNQEPATANWQATMQNAASAYLSNSENKAKVGSFAATHKQLNNTSSASDSQAAQSSFGVSPQENPFLVRFAPQAAQPLASTPEPESLSMEIPGFNGMKKPFAQPFSQPPSNIPVFDTIETIMPQRRPTAQSQSGVPQASSGSVAAQEPGIPEGKVTPLSPPAASEQTKPFGQEISSNENNIPAGMFMQFDNIPNI